MFNCRAMHQTSSTTLPILLSQCWKFFGGQIKLNKTQDIRSCSPLQPHQCLVLPTPMTVSFTKKNLKVVCCKFFNMSGLSGTVPEMREFNLYVGTFLHDVELRNITFTTGVLTVEESNARGFTVQQHVFDNGTSVFSIKVPFDTDVIFKHVCWLLQVFLAYWSTFLVNPKLSSSKESRGLGDYLHPQCSLWLCHSA